MKKALILTMFGVALWFVLAAWYAQGNQGMPNPTVIRNPVYLYGTLALVSDFLEGIPVVLAVVLTVALIWQVQGSKKTTVKKTPAKTATG